MPDVCFDCGSDRVDKVKIGNDVFVVCLDCSADWWSGYEEPPCKACGGSGVLGDALCEECAGSGLRLPW
jgi:hypothetical protein